MPNSARLVINKLAEQGYEAYVVGGCVRDSILGRHPDDWDVTTNAQPCEIKKVFARTVDTGIAHGTVTVLIGSEAVEVTTYRIDGEYTDNRRPDSVEFTSRLSDDLKRRDFTINAMAYNDQEGLIDIFGGEADLKAQIVRCVGDAKERFSEDALRILRAVRFAAQLGFSIEDETKAAISELAGSLSNISAERIQIEIIKLLVSPRPEIWGLVWELGITKVIMSEFDVMMETEQDNPHHMYNVGEHTLKVLANVRADKVLRIAALLHDIGKPARRTTDSAGINHFKGHSEMGVTMARDFLKRLKFDNDTTNNVLRLIKWHDLRLQADERLVRSAIYRMGDDIFPYFIELQYADTMGKSTYGREAKLKLNADLRTLYTKIKTEQQCISLKDLAINGKDLVALGIKRGPVMGELLRTALEQVLEDPQRNTKECLLSYIKAEL